MRRFRVEIDPPVLFIGSVLILLIPFRWLASVFLAAVVHEGAHWVFVLLLDGSISSIKVGVQGAVMDARLSDPFAEFLSILAGPVSSCTLYLFRNVFPELAICGIVHGIYNFIPILPLDGGRMLQCVLLSHVPHKAASILDGIRILFAVLLLFIGIYGLYIRKWYLTAGIALILHFFTRNNPCKDEKIKVQ